MAHREKSTGNLNNALLAALIGRAGGRTTLRAWCDENGFRYDTAKKALRLKRHGAKSREIIAAARREIAA